MPPNLLLLTAAGNHMEASGENYWAVGLCPRDLSDVRRGDGRRHLRANRVLLVVPLRVHLPVAHPVQPGLQPWSGDLPHPGGKQGESGVMKKLHLLSACA
jgi:hypothetical protein